MIDPVKKVFRFFGVLAGLGTVIWVMRDRFISLALPREPEPPTFRVAPHPPHPAEEQLAPVDDLTIIKGVGPVYAARLEDAGITSLAGLSTADAEALASVVDVPVGRVGDWIEEATFLSSFRGN
jgi:hypothetical protein